MRHHIYNASANAWLQDDEKTWSPDFFTAAGFTTIEYAETIRLRETKGGAITYVAAFNDYLAAE